MKVVPYFADPRCREALEAIFATSRWSEQQGHSFATSRDPNRTAHCRPRSNQIQYHLELPDHHLYVPVLVTILTFHNPPLIKILYRAYLTMLALIAPELVNIGAICQWSSAQELEK